MAYKGRGRRMGSTALRAARQWGEGAVWVSGNMGCQTLGQVLLGFSDSHGANGCPRGTTAVGHHSRDQPGLVRALIRTLSDRYAAMLSRRTQRPRT